MHPLLTGYFNFIQKLIPAKSESSAIGVDIGVAEVKMAELTKAGDEYELINWATEAVKGGDVTGAVASVVSKCMHSPKNVVLSIYGKGTLIRYIDLPRMSIEDLRNSFGIEADKYFPFSQDQIYTDCYILDAKNKDKKMRVMAAAAKKEIVEGRLKLLTELGLQSNFIGLNPMALANVFNVIQPKKKGEEAVVSAVFDFGESVSSLTVLVDNVPKFNRDIYIGGRELTKRIGNALNVDFEEAEKIKCQPKDKKEEILAICESLLMNLMQELRLSFDYFATENHLTVQELYVTGGSSLLDGLVEMLSKELEIPIHAWDPFENLKTKMSDEEKKTHAAKLGAALGLALYNYD